MTFEDDGPRLLDTATAAKLLGFSTRQLDRWRARGSGPEWIPVGPARTPRYHRLALEQYLKSQVVEPIDAALDELDEDLADALTARLQKLGREQRSFAVGVL